MVLPFSFYICFMRGKGIIIIICLALAWSCNNSYNLIINSWKVSKVDFLNEEQSLVQTDTLKGNNIQKLTREILRDILLKNIYQFNSDGTCKITDLTHETKFNYTLKGQRAIVFSNPENGSSKEIAIEKLTQDELIIITKSDQSSLQTKLTLTPIK